MKVKKTVVRINLAQVVFYLLLLLFLRYLYTSQVNREIPLPEQPCPLIFMGPTRFGNESRLIFYNPSDKEIQNIRISAVVENEENTIVVSSPLEPNTVRYISMKEVIGRVDEVRFCCGKCYSVKPSDYPSRGCDTNKCRSDAAESEMNPLYCGGMKDWDYAFNCLARSIPNDEICEQIIDRELKNICKLSAEAKINQTLGLPINLPNMSSSAVPVTNPVA